MHYVAKHQYFCASRIVKYFSICFLLAALLIAGCDDDDDGTSYSKDTNLYRDNGDNTRVVTPAPGAVILGSIDNSGTWNNLIGTFNNEGIFKGTGTFVGTLDAGSGTIAPGSSAGTMYVDGDFILDGSGILEIEIGGFTPGTFDILDITGTAYMPGGNINFSFLDGYDIITDVGPYQSMELTFLNAGYIDSLFNPVINYNFMSLPYFQFNVFQQGNELVFEATNLVPAPPAILLGSIGLAFASWKLRRRKVL